MINKILQISHSKCVFHNFSLLGKQVGTTFQLRVPPTAAASTTQNRPVGRHLHLHLHLRHDGIPQSEQNESHATVVGGMRGQEGVSIALLGSIVLSSPTVPLEQPAPGTGGVPVARLHDDGPRTVFRQPFLMGHPCVRLHRLLVYRQADKVPRSRSCERAQRKCQAPLCVEQRHTGGGVDNLSATLQRWFGP